MRTQTECRILTSKNSAKLKQYYYFHAEFLEEIRYCWSVMQLFHVGGVGACLANDTIYCCKNSEREREREREP